MVERHIVEDLTAADVLMESVPDDIVAQREMVNRSPTATSRLSCGSIPVRPQPWRRSRPAAKRSSPPSPKARWRASMAIMSAMRAAPSSEPSRPFARGRAEHLFTNQPRPRHRAAPGPRSIVK
ncbi:Hypothetical protein A7982_11555 [Minicystis rosea]|nr:Hypothetical protein A7982_11555 [Minicystis rosea]